MQGNWYSPLPAPTHPIIKNILDTYTAEKIHGIVHCSGGAQTKVLHFIKKLRGKR